MLVFNIE